MRLAGVQRSFGDVHAVRGIDLTIGQGEVVAFLGPNGAGKTTTIDLILGLGEPDAGSVEVFGLTPRAAIARGLVAAVMQSGGLLKDITVAETVELTASLFAHAQPVGDVLQRAGIADIAGAKVGTCSGGQQQRLRFAMALTSDPALIVLDEPTTGMDVAGRRDFWAAIRQDADRGRTVLFATHYLEEADAYADRIVLVRDGQIVADGTGAQIKAQASGRVVRATAPDLDPHLLHQPFVQSVEHRGEQLLIHTTDSDEVARILLSRNAYDLEITAQGLEDAFVALTSKEQN
ncbi:ABC transporter ATP-binding protein [Calidifontibacter sp. DB0510]|uniref:ABC transporter ATP-binding protein n=1 Tax=Metallococcus carri TaxID=1656884 RepID=A0A967EHY8_9MICO|nr:ABC transporter ATP-binding protein [Metallococcus carri]NOP39181.1 ABC transporter ATP-binding protein [Calidifontibacter sp. DB2511S]